MTLNGRTTSVYCAIATSAPKDQELNDTVAVLHDISFPYLLKWVNEKKSVGTWWLTEEVIKYYYILIIFQYFVLNLETVFIV